MVLSASLNIKIYTLFSTHSHVIHQSSKEPTPIRWNTSSKSQTLRNQSRIIQKNQLYRKATRKKERKKKGHMRTFPVSNVISILVGNMVSTRIFPHEKQKRRPLIRLIRCLVIAKPASGPKVQAIRLMLNLVALPIGEKSAQRMVIIIILIPLN